MPPSPPSSSKKKKRRPINISNDVWWNIFEWLFRAELGLKMAFVSPRFDAIVDKFLAQKSWSIGILKTQLASNGEIWCFDNDKRILGKFPIAQTPPPNGLKQFKSIRLSYFDNTVLQFLRNLQPLFIKNGINLILNVCNFTCGRSPKWWPISSPEVWPLLETNVVRLALCDDYDFCSSSERLPADFLFQFANLYLVDSRDIFPEPPPVVASPAPLSSAHSLWLWLHSPRADGRPKVLLCQEIWPFADKIGALQKAFSDASSPVSFIVRLSLGSFAGQPFELRNGRTGEVLNMEMVAEANATEENVQNNEGEGHPQQQPQVGQQQGDDHVDDNDDILTHYIVPKRNVWLLKRRPPTDGGGQQWPNQWAHLESEAIAWNWTGATNVIEMDNEEDVDQVDEGEDVNEEDG